MLSSQRSSNIYKNLSHDNVRASFALQGEVTFIFISLSRNFYGRDEIYNILRVWGLIPQLGIHASSPMIMMKKLIPHQRANTRDPEVRNPALKGGEGS
jgi:hypothetical protein